MLQNGPGAPESSLGTKHNSHSAARKGTRGATHALSSAELCFNYFTSNRSWNRVGDGTDTANWGEIGRWRKISQNPRKNAEHFPQIVHTTDDTRAIESLLRGVLLQRKRSFPRLSKIHSRPRPPTHHLQRAYESWRRQDRSKGAEGRRARGDRELATKWWADTECLTPGLSPQKTSPFKSVVTVLGLSLNLHSTLENLPVLWRWAEKY